MTEEQFQVAIEEAEDRGYVRAVSDIADYHRTELKKIEASFEKSFAAGIPIGTVWEGKFVSPDQLKELAHYHTEILKVIEEKFANP